MEEMQDLIPAFIECEATADEDSEDGFVRVSVGDKVFADCGRVQF